MEKELIGELANVPGKRGIFTRMVDAALEHPDDTVRDAVYPVVPGGVKTLSALARELKATERAVAERVRYQLRGSYSHYYRRMLAPLLAALEFRCNNSAYRPVMDAIGLLARYAGTDSDQKVYAAGEKVPVDGVVPKAWLDGVTDDDGRMERIPYELCVLIALRDALRRREVYVQGAGRWKNPDEDLPGDFEDNRDVHYAELGKPLDAAEFVAGLRKRLDDGLTRLDTALARGTSGGVRIITRQGSPWVSVPKLDKLPEPKNLGALKAEVERRWGTIDLLDILKDTAFITGFTGSFASVASREVLDRATLAGGCCWCCSRSAPTWASGRWPSPASTASARPSSATSAPPTSPARTCGRRSPPSSTRPSRRATRSGGARRPAPRRTPGGSHPGTPT